MIPDDFTTFKLILELKSPIYSPSYPICLDAVLCALINKRFPDFEETKVELDKMLHRTGDTYHGSSMIFGVTEAQQLIARKLNTVRQTRIDSDLRPSMFSPNGRGGKYQVVKIYEGEAKNRFIEHRCLYAPCLIFYGLGDAEEILKYFQYLAMGIGKNSNRMGFGSIGKARMATAEEDVSLIGSDGLPNRPLSIEFYRKLSKNEGAEGIPSVRTKIPYYCSSTEEVGVSPASVRVELQENLGILMR